MANSKHAHLRYNFLDECFRNRNYTFNQLLRVINERIASYYPGEGVEERTLREDIALFRDPVEGFGAPLPEKIRNYRYSDTEFTIAQRSLLKQEQYIIDSAQHLLTRFDNDPSLNRLSNVLLEIQDKDYKLTNATQGVLYFDGNEEYDGKRHLQPFFLHIRKKEVLSITTQRFDGNDKKTFIFHPYILKQYNKRWFIFGYNETLNIAKFSIPLDERIIGYEIDDASKYLDSKTDWDRHFINMVGVRKDENQIAETVVLKFSKSRLPYFLSKPFLTGSDQPIQEGAEEHVFFESIINLELVQQILSYGKDVEVLEPKKLKDQMRLHAKTMYDFYE